MGLGWGCLLFGSNAYIRLHGRNEGAWYAVEESPNGSARYCHDYSENELSQFVPIIKHAKREGKKVQFYFNNHPNGSGAKKGLKLKEMIGMDENSGK